MTLDLRKEFHKDMIAIYQNAKKECGYNATRFLQMVAAQDSVTVAKSFIHTKPTEGFTTLWELGRLDLTVEALMLQPKYASLFTDEEREVVRERLKEYGYRVIVQG
jgi:5-methylcytosine-specific restriction enzyme A